jgi:hypothetical protein
VASARRLLLLRRRCSTSVGADEQSLVSWVREQGGRVGALQQRHSGHGGWGLRTTDAVRAGESLIALPPHLPLSVQTSDPLLLALFDRIPGSCCSSSSSRWSFELILLTLTLLVKPNFHATHYFIPNMTWQGACILKHNPEHLCKANSETFCKTF